MKIETFKTLLLEQLVKDCDVHLPYYLEHKPETYSSRLLMTQRKMQALIGLQAITQAEIDQNMNVLTNGLTIAEAVERILAVVNVSKC
jgi:hypothetical protein